MTTMSTCLWFDQHAEEAVALYRRAFPAVSVGAAMAYGDEQASATTIELALPGASLLMLNGGPQFTINPSISFFVDCETQQQVDTLWEVLSEGGMTLMPLMTYDFSDRFGWVMDRFGVSWQVTLSRQPQAVSPFLMFVNEQYGRAEEAMRFYTTLVEDGTVDFVRQHPVGGDEQPGTLMQGRFRLAGQRFIAMDSGFEHQFRFNEAVSLVVHCDTQAEIDRLWAALSALPEAEQCGWLKDRFGVSWQIVPSNLTTLLTKPDEARTRAAMQALLGMKKLDIAALEAV